MARCGPVVVEFRNFCATVMQNIALNTLAVAPDEF